MRTLKSALVYATSYFRACLFIFILFLGDLPSYTPPFRRIRCSRYMRMSCGMPGFSSDHTTGLSACRVVLGVAEAFRAARLALRGCSVFCACDSSPCRALILARVVPMFGAPRSTLMALLSVSFLRAIAVLHQPLTPPGLL